MLNRFFLISVLIVFQARLPWVLGMWRSKTPKWRHHHHHLFFSLTQERSTLLDPKRQNHTKIYSQTYGQRSVLSLQGQPYTYSETGHAYIWTSLFEDTSTDTYRDMCSVPVFVFSGSHWLFSISLGPDIAAGNAWECKAIITFWGKSFFIFADLEAQIFQSG